MFSDAKIRDKFTAIHIDSLEALEFTVTSIVDKHSIICGNVKKAVANSDYGICFFQKDGRDTGYSGWRLFPLGTTITVNYPEE